MTLWVMRQSPFDEEYGMGTYDDGEGDTKVMEHAPVAPQVLPVAQLGELIFIPSHGVWPLSIHCDEVVGRRPVHGGRVVVAEYGGSWLSIKVTVAEGPAMVGRKLVEVVSYDYSVSRRLSRS